MPETRQPDRFQRSRSESIIAGVCGGTADYFGLDVTLVRVVWVVASIFVLPGAGILAYLLLWLLAPEEPVPPETGPPNP